MRLFNGRWTLIDSRCDYYAIVTLVQSNAAIDGHAIGEVGVATLHAA